MNTKSLHRRRSAGFTLTELLVVLSTLLILMSILIPAIAGVRKRGYEVRTRAIVQKIASACQVYDGDWHAFPGILPESQLYGKNGGGKVTIAGGGTSSVTSTENLTLSLLGGLTPDQNFASFNFTASKTSPLTTNGALSLNPSNPKRYNAYIDYVASEMDWVPSAATPGDYKALYSGPAAEDDSAIPEFLDGYPDPKPIIYMRAHVGAPAVIDDTSDPLAQQGSQYHTEDVTAYAGTPSGGPQPGHPFDIAFNGTVQANMRDSKHFLSWYDALRNEGMTQLDNSGNGNAAPGSAEVPKGKDGFILIAAGSSRAWLGKDAIIVSN